MGRSAMEPRGVGSHPPLHPSRFFHPESTRGHYGERAEENPVAEGVRGSSTSRMHGPPRSHPRSFDPLALATAVAIAVLGFLPVANWVAGGHHAPWYAPVASTWVTGSVLAIGIGLVLAIASRRIPALWHDGLGARFAVAVDRSPALMLTGLAVLSVVVYAVIAHVVFDAKPLLVDEIFQVWQARVFGDGRLTQPVASHPEFFSGMHLVEAEGRAFAHFPPGHSALLMVGELIGAPWIIVPIAGGIAVAAFGVYLRVAEPHVTVRVGALALFALAPFVAFMSATYMNHTTALMCLMIAIAALAHAVKDDVRHPVAALVCGLGLGLAATIRPIDAVAFALPAGGWMLVRAIRSRARWLEAGLAGVGVALPLLALAWFNARTTGDPLLLGYEMLWGKEHGLGFRSTPWGASHSPARGLELVNLYFLRLQTYLFEWPIPSLLPLVGALALARHLDRFDRYLLGSGALLVAIYFAFWHDGFYLGPRYVYPLVPLLCLWTARFPAFIHERLGDGLSLRTTVYSLAAAAAIATISLVPQRARQYAAGLTTMRWDADAAAHEAGVNGGLVFVRESWGSQLVARLWALGLTRAQTERLYARVDACLLEQGVTRLEQQGVRGQAAADAFAPLMRDSLRVVPSTLSPDASERVLPGSRYTPRCLRRIADDRRGFTLLTPLFLAGSDGTVYARDLHERDTLLLAAHPGREVWLLRPADSSSGAVPRFERLDRDSVLRAARQSVNGKDDRIQNTEFRIQRRPVESQ